MTLAGLVPWLDYASVLVFALTGALVASRAQLDLVGFIFFATLTGIGGGTVRDLLIGAPVFWITDPWVAAVCLGTALIAWFTPVRWWEGKGFDYADGAGLAAYAVLGSAKALAYGIPPVPAALMGVITGCVGGIFRDVVAGRPSIIMSPELYVTPAALSAALTVAGVMVAPWLGVDDAWAWGLGFVCGFALRTAAIRWEWGLPSYGERA